VNKAEHIALDPYGRNALWSSRRLFDRWDSLPQTKAPSLRVVRITRTVLLRAVGGSESPDWNMSSRIMVPCMKRPKNKECSSSGK